MSTLDLSASGTSASQCTWTSGGGAHGAGCDRVLDAVEQLTV